MDLLSTQGKSKTQHYQSFMQKGCQGTYYMYGLETKHTWVITSYYDRIVFSIPPTNI